MAICTPLDDGVAVRFNSISAREVVRRFLELGILDEDKALRLVSASHLNAIRIPLEDCDCDWDWDCEWNVDTDDDSCNEEC